MAFKKRVRIIKKIREAASLWRFISLHRIHGRYVWDKRPGYFFIEWWEGRKRRRQMAGQTPSDALEAQRRKANELIGELAAGGKKISQPTYGEHAKQAKVPTRKRSTTTAANRRRTTKRKSNRLFAKCDESERAKFSTLLLTGLREQELYFLGWPDVDLQEGAVRVTPKPEEGF